MTDTSPLIFLSKVRRLELMPSCFREVFAPEGVLVEWGTKEPPHWIQASQVSRNGERFVQANLGALHRGELEAMALARERGVTWLLMDDRLAREKATHMGLRCVGTVGVLLYACRLGEMTPDQSRDAVNELITRHGLYLSADLYAEVLGRLDRD